MSQFEIRGAEKKCHVTSLRWNLLGFHMNSAPDKDLDKPHLNGANPRQNRTERRDFSVRFLLCFPALNISA